MYNGVFSVSINGVQIGNGIYCTFETRTHKITVLSLAHIIYNSQQHFSGLSAFNSRCLVTVLNTVHAPASTFTSLPATD
jgi:hypothetical protein